MIETVNNYVILTDKTYNFVKQLVLVFIPACSSLYFGLAAIWGLPYSEQVVGTLAVVATFLGVCLGVSTNQYNASGAAYNGQLVVQTKEDGGKLITLQLDDDPELIEEKEKVAFKVEKPGEELPVPVPKRKRRM